MQKLIPSLFEIELICARMWGYRQNLVVPNVSWGAGVHECDLLILSKSNWASEIEIKRSLSDLKKDAKKKHGHDNEKIRYLYFAIPDKLLKHQHVIPERAGIISISLKDETRPAIGFRGDIVREPTVNSQARKWEQRERHNLSRLGALRIWGLKQKVIEAKKSTSNENA